MTFPLIASALPSLLGVSGSSMFGLSSLMPTGLGLGKAIMSQLAQNFINDNLPDGPMKTLLLEAVTNELGPGLPGNPGTTEGISDLLSESFGLDSAETFEQVQDMEGVMEDFLMNMLEDKQRDEESQGGSEASGGSGKSSWIRAMAEKLGELMDNQWAVTEASIDKVSKLGEDSTSGGGFGDMMKGIMGKSTSAEKAKAQLPSATAEMQGDMQQFSMVMNAATTAIKTGGEANTGMARKQ